MRLCCSSDIVYKGLELVDLCDELLLKGLICLVYLRFYFAFVMQYHVLYRSHLIESELVILVYFCIYLVSRHRDFIL